jgi:hypothetical protein
MGIYADFINAPVIPSSNIRVGKERIAYNEIRDLRKRGDPEYMPEFDERDEVQVLPQFIGVPSGGNYTITIVDEVGVEHTTANIPYNTFQVGVRNAINAVMTADGYPNWTNGDISVSGALQLLGGDMQLTFDGSSVTYKNFGQTLLTDVDLVDGTVGTSTTTQHGQPKRTAWAVMHNLGMFMVPPEYGANLPDDSQLALIPSINPRWPSASLCEKLAAQAAIEDNNPQLKAQLEQLLRIQG